AAEQEDSNRFELRLAVVRQGVSRPNELWIGGPQVVHPLVRLGQLPPRLAELRIETNGAGVFDHRELVAFFRGVLVPPLVVALFLYLRTAAGDERCGKG